MITHLRKIHQTMQTTAFFSWGILLLASFAGCGKLKPAPGSWGSAAGLLAAIAVYAAFGQIWVFVSAALLFIIGIYAAHHYGIMSGIIDNGEIVIDEAAAIFLVVAFFPLTLFHLIGGFVLFRIFDIVKPFPIAFFDRTLKNGFGVMFDDILAACYAIAALFFGEFLFAVFI